MLSRFVAAAPEDAVPLMETGWNGCRKEVAPCGLYLRARKKAPDCFFQVEK
jgi:hypothetical protein